VQGTRRLRAPTAPGLPGGISRDGGEHQDRGRYQNADIGRPCLFILKDTPPAQSSGVAIRSRPVTIVAIICYSGESQCVHFWPRSCSRLWLPGAAQAQSGACTMDQSGCRSCTDWYQLCSSNCTANARCQPNCRQRFDLCRQSGAWTDSAGRPHSGLSQQ
jgi:hypothetical protein